MTITIFRYELNLLMKHEEVSMFQKISQQGTVQLLKIQEGRKTLKCHRFFLLTSSVPVRKPRTKRY